MAHYITTLITERNNIAFQIRDAAYIVHKRDNLLVWDIYAATQHGKERFIAAYYGANVDEFGCIPEPRLSDWWYKHWLYFNICVDTNSEQLIVKPLGICAKCGKLLTDPVSITRGYGPECIKHIKQEELNCEHMD